MESDTSGVGWKRSGLAGYDECIESFERCHRWIVLMNCFPNMWYVSLRFLIRCNCLENKISRYMFVYPDLFSKLPTLDFVRKQNFNILVLPCGMASRSSEQIWKVIHPKSKENGEHCFLAEEKLAEKNVYIATRNFCDKSAWSCKSSFQQKNVKRK